MPYTDIKTDLILNEISEEQLHSQQSLPPNQYWLTDEDGDESPVVQLKVEVEELKQTKANIYPVVGKYQQHLITTTSGVTIKLSDYINPADYVEGGVYEIYIQGYLYSENSRKTYWTTDLLPSTYTTFNVSGYGRQNGWVGVLAASQYIKIVLNGNLDTSAEWCAATLTGYRRLY